MLRYCPKCKLRIDFVDNDTKCPVCAHATIIETDDARVRRVRDKFIKLTSS